MKKAGPGSKVKAGETDTCAGWNFQPAHGWYGNEEDY